MKKIILFLNIFFISCSYTPTAQLADSIFNDKIYVNVELSPLDPQNSVFIADALKQITINRLGKKLALKDEANDIINVRINNLSFSPLVYDQHGYVVRYKAKLSLDFYVVFMDGTSANFTTGGSYNFDISPNSIISDNAKTMAIKYASSEAFDEFISVIAIRRQGGVTKY
ncbi:MULTISPECIES: LPS assembly lipoprotein LptE [unclassified Campylobacter]|uniref:LPS assembly lipoprotein LptE n=1 Tax=unclassified Campylobacter TaxID=2593542 RepID=UPI001237D9E9|nr:MULTISPECIES: LPS assembly lipoprotein LptE [unclassified Campylobacter]KAA6225625.1 hypothetical protein FMM54_05770 [Campylobacter sp. LR185c]KAA6227523.1 hypothetical protein FMM55_03005 [Campylobacter sp. LR196d]KAA6228550.1 hypothetical protein FMM57_03015 [Campylobacter sp. LR286c]KAA6230940.1 hypothetical protein FMM58_04425 [Campylobacter sp. LR291e]KAA6233574.1 hypothetical protein FMM56_03430 [Campylobacter sp. LR264d]